MSIMEERMAEIHRRSQQILQKRRKRRQLICALCIPLFFCGALAFLYQPPQKNIASLSAGVPEPEDAGIEIGQAEKYICFSHTEAKDFSLFGAPLENPTDRGEPNCSGSYVVQDNADIAEEYGGSTKGSASAVYTLYMTNADGSITEYRLCGNLLTELSTGQLYQLTDEQVAQLLDSAP